jgi:putative heme-binding domain-containing protein
VVGAGGTEADVAQAFGLLGESKESGAAWQLAILEGLGQGLQSSGRSLRKIWETPPPALKEGVARALPFFERAAAAARDEKRPLSERLSAVRLLGIGPFGAGAAPLQELLNPRHPADIQLAAVRALSAQDQPKVAAMLLAGWNSYSPSLRREVIEALVARADRARQLLDAVEQKKVLAAQIEVARVDQLRKHSDAELRKRAQTLFGSRPMSDRQKVVDEYRPALDLKADAARGKMVFKKTCTVCHRLENEGVEVGPDLLSALKTKTREGLMIDILDPSREVDPRYINYLVTTKDGRILTGMIAVESPSSITLRRAEKAEDTVLRNQIDEIQATAKSLMPDELEKQLSKQDLADVIAYLLAVAGK